MPQSPHLSDDDKNDYCEKSVLESDEKHLPSARNRTEKKKKLAIIFSDGFKDFTNDCCCLKTM